MPVHRTAAPVEHAADPRRSALQQNMPRPGVKGVTDTTIRVAASYLEDEPARAQLRSIRRRHAGRSSDEVDAAGGIYGRKIKIVAKSR